MEHRVAALGVEDLVGRGQLDDLHPVQRPAVRLGHRLQLVPGLRQGDVQSSLAAGGAVEQELEREGGLPCARRAFDQVHAMLRESAAEHEVEAGDPDAEERRRAGGSGRRSR